VGTSETAACGGSVGASETAACGGSVGASETAACGGSVGASETTACCAVCTCGTVLSSTNTAGTSSVSCSAETVRVDTRVGLVGSVRAVRASRVV
jgi:hypothetical protein